MKVFFNSRNIFFLALIFSLIIFVLVFNLHNDSAAFKKFLDFGHVFVFGIIALSIHILIETSRGKKTGYISSFIIAMIIGLVIEIAQLFMRDRFFELGDLLNDSIGAIAFLMIHAAYKKRLKAIPAVSISLILIALAGIPFYIALFDEWLSLKRFPVINSFENPLEILSWNKSNADISRSCSPDKRACQAQIAFFPGEYSTLCIESFIHDWRDYRFFIMDVYLPGNESLVMLMRINDKAHNDEYNDRFNRSFTIKPGENRILIDLADIKKSRDLRLLDMSKISRICIFAAGLKKPREVFIDNIRLEN